MKTAMLTGTAATEALQVYVSLDGQRFNSRRVFRAVLATPSRISLLAGLRQGRWKPLSARLSRLKRWKGVRASSARVARQNGSQRLTPERLLGGSA